VVSPRGSAIASPDDLDFDSEGRLDVAECMNARVTKLADGAYRVIEDDVEGANGITAFEDRIFVTEFLPSGSIFEVFRDDRPSLLLAEGIAGPNGMCVGPDRHLYSALPFAGQVVRVSIEGGPAEVVAEVLAVPCSCRTGTDGLVHVGLGGSGDVVTIDTATREVVTVHRTGASRDGQPPPAPGRPDLRLLLHRRVRPRGRGDGPAPAARPGADGALRTGGHRCRRLHRRWARRRPAVV
jgi:hypothetical protein